jgi:protein kinase A
MLLDYLPGGELFTLIRSQVYMSLEDSKFYIAEIVLGVEQLHSRDIIYRDLKP